MENDPPDVLWETGSAEGLNESLLQWASWSGFGMKEICSSV